MRGIVAVMTASITPILIHTSILTLTSIPTLTPIPTLIPMTADALADADIRTERRGAGSRSEE